MTSGVSSEDKNRDKCIICYEPHTTEKESGLGVELNQVMAILKRSFDISFPSRFNDYGDIAFCRNCFQQLKKLEKIYHEVLEVESKFDAIREQVALSVVDSVIKSDYLNNNPNGNPFDSIRLLVFGRWEAKYNTVTGKKSCSVFATAVNGTSEEEEPGHSSPVTSAATASTIRPVSLQVHRSPSGTTLKRLISPSTNPLSKKLPKVEVTKASIVRAAISNGETTKLGTGVRSTNHQQKKIILVKRDPKTGKIVHIQNKGQRFVAHGGHNKQFVMVKNPQLLNNPNVREFATNGSPRYIISSSGVNRSSSLSKAPTGPPKLLRIGSGITSSNPPKFHIVRSGTGGIGFSRRSESSIILENPKSVTSIKSTQSSIVDVDQNVETNASDVPVGELPLTPSTATLVDQAKDSTIPDEGIQKKIISENSLQPKEPEQEISPSQQSNRSRRLIKRTFASSNWASGRELDKLVRQVEAEDKRLSKQAKRNGTSLSSQKNDSLTVKVEPTDYNESAVDSLAYIDDGLVVLTSEDDAEENEGTGTRDGKSSHALPRIQSDTKP